MTKIDSFRRIFLPCFYPSTTTTTVTKKRFSASLRDDLQNPSSEGHSSSTSTSPPVTAAATLAPPRPSKTMVIGTIFGSRRGHVFFCFQHDRLSTTKPLLLLELSVLTHQLVKEMQCGLVRIVLESQRTGAGSVSCPLRSIPVWTVSCNGKKIGFALKRKVSENHRMILKTMQSMTIGAGVIPAGLGPGGPEEEKEQVMYMRANYEHVVGSANSESFHLINPEEGSGQELSVFLIRLKMLEGKAIVCETDLPEQMQSHVMELAYQALDLHEVSDCQSIAHYIKQKFDEAYGPAWHCVVGKEFGSCITHLCGSFIFFRVEMMEFLIFKDGKDESKEEAIGMLQKSQDQNHSS